MNIEQNTDEEVDYSYENMDTLAKEVKAQQLIDNKVVEKQRVNIISQHDFLEQNLKRMELQEEDESNTKFLWKESILEDSKVILEGKRTPYIKQKLVSLKETNMINAGLMVEYRYWIFVACKDGSVRCFLFNPEDYSQSQLIKQWSPHFDTFVKQMSICKNRLITLAMTNDLKVWDIDPWLQGKRQDPRCLVTLQKILRFQIRFVQQEQYLDYIRQDAIESMKMKTINLNLVENKTSIDIKDNEFFLKDINYGMIYNDGTVIKQMDNEGLENTIYTKEATQKIKGMYLEGSSLIIILDDTVTQDTVLIIKELSAEKLQQQAEQEQFMLQQQQALFSSRKTSKKPTVEEEDSDEQEPVDKSVTITKGNDIGSCQAVFKSTKSNYIIATGTTGLFVMKGTEIYCKIQTEFSIQMAIFTNDEHYILTVGDDGRVRFIEWSQEIYISPESLIEETEIQDAVASLDGKYFALLSQKQKVCTIYNYTTMKQICKLGNLDSAFLTNFSANSKVFQMVYEDIHHYGYFIVVLVAVDNSMNLKAPPFKIQVQGFPNEVDTCVTCDKLFIIAQTEGGSSLNVYNYGESKPDRIIKNIMTLSVSPDEKQIAYADSAGSIFIVYIKTWEIMSTIKASDDEYIAALDRQGQLLIFDIQSKYAGKECQIKTKPLKKIQNKISSHLKPVEHIPWCCIGNHIILQLENEKELIFQKNPFLHPQFSSLDSLDTPFDSIDGYFIPLLIGGPILGTGSFAEIYTNAYESCLKSETAEAIQSLQTPLFPYKLNALHYFAMHHNVDALELCFKKRVKWIQDVFGKSPLDYALQSGDRSIIEACIQGLYQMLPDDRQEVMRSLPLTILLRYSAMYLAPLLRDSGASEPEKSQYCGGADIPKIFPLQKTRFGESSLPIYDLQMRDQLHPQIMNRKKTRNRAVATFVLNNPVPQKYSEDSLELLEMIAECKNDEVVRSKPITLYLNRKWDGICFKFYLVQFCLFITLLLSLTFLNSFEEPYMWYTLFSIAFTINTYFLLYECVQMCIQHLNYIKDTKNILDLTRLTLIYLYLNSQRSGQEVISTVQLPLTFLLMWFKILNYFQVFKQTRYLIKMIFEIIGDILIFLVILFTACFAYAQISYSISSVHSSSDPDLHIGESLETTNSEIAEPESFYTHIQMSYVLSLGELGAFDTFNVIRFLMFVLFSFFIPLVLLNMLIALMADSYTRVQSNAIAADCRALAEMELEMEELVYFFYSTFKPHLTQNMYYYCFCTKINDGEDDDEGWEGTVGQLKATIKEQSEELQAQIISQVNQQIKEKTNDIIERIVKTNTETQVRIDQTQKLVEKESKQLNRNVSESTFNESRNVQVLVNKTHEQQESLIKNVNEQVKIESSKQLDDSRKTTNQILDSIDKHDKSQITSQSASEKKVKEQITYTNDQQKDLFKLVETIKSIQKIEMESIAEQEKTGVKRNQFDMIAKSLEKINKLSEDQIKISQVLRDEFDQQNKDVKNELFQLQSQVMVQMDEVKQSSIKAIEKLKHQQSSSETTMRLELQNVFQAISGQMSQEDLQRLSRSKSPPENEMLGASKGSMDQVQSSLQQSLQLIKKKEIKKKATKKEESNDV